MQKEIYIFSTQIQIEVVYFPSESKIVPAKPYVPNLITQEMFAEYTDQNELSNYLLPDAPYLNILDWEKFKESQKGFYLETEGQDYINLSGCFSTLWNWFKKQKR